MELAAVALDSGMAPAALLEAPDALEDLVVVLQARRAQSQTQARQAAFADRADAAFAAAAGRARR